jgi:hypothetical protein
VAAGGAVAAAVVSEGEGDGDPDGESPGVGGATGLADGVGVGSSAIAGVPRNDAVKATARSGGARKRWICKVSRKDCRTGLRERT